MNKALGPQKTPKKKRPTRASNKQELTHRHRHTDTEAAERLKLHGTRYTDLLILLLLCCKKPVEAKQQKCGCRDDVVVIQFI